MKIFFVLDIRNGIAVHAERGERENYRPIKEKSLLVETNDPILIVETLKPRFLYVADLDRIAGRGDNFRTINALAERVEELIADCGFKGNEELSGLKFKPVLATETFDIRKIRDGCYVSLDFFGNFLDSSGNFRDHCKAVEFLNNFELEGLIVLNVRRVGSLSVDFELVSEILEISENPVLVGGGVGSLEDLRKLHKLGCSGALIATAIHKKILPIALIRDGYFKP